MTPVKTKPKFRCEFCRFVGGRVAVERHEPRCYKNPDRVCDFCNSMDVYPYREDDECPFCKGIEEWEKQRRQWAIEDGKEVGAR